jgi:preprotein translocase subunit SecA
MNRHREVIYGDRREVVSGQDMSERIKGMIEAEIDALVAARFGDGRSTDFDPDLLLESFKALIPQSALTVDQIDGLNEDDLVSLLADEADRAYAEVESRFGPELMRKVERHVMLNVIDRLWVEHLTAMDDLRDGVGLQAYGQRDPLVVYKTEGFKMFQALQEHIHHDVVHTIFRVQPVVAQQPVRTRVTEQATTTNLGNGDGAAAPRRARKIGPNEPCPCGSGKKYKRCHGAPAGAVGNRA